MARGRPAVSIVRKHLAEMLFVFGELTAYEAHQHYIKIFASCTQRNVYYQLQRGVENGIFSLEEKEEKGDFSWGTTSRKVYYSLKNKEGVVMDSEVKKYYDSLKK